MSRKLNEEDILAQLMECDESGDLGDVDFSDGSDDNYEPSEEESFLSEKSSEDNGNNTSSENDESQSTESGENNYVSTFENVTVWSIPDENFQSRKTVQAQRTPIISSHIGRSDSVIQIFGKTFPRSLLIYITQCTNERLELLRKSPKYRSLKPTDIGEIQVVIGCTLIMSYMRLPAMRHYWSKHKAMGNEAIKSAIARDRFLTISSKMYFSSPEKPVGASKTYYVDDMVKCLKSRFQAARADSPYQSIDESMTKFKGRSSLKQYMPLKPTKRGIKMWMRCDSQTGYCYDFNIYCGKEEGPTIGTLGERVVKTLVSTIREPDVTLCFDRFFTSVNLLESLAFPALGTCMANRKNLPKITQKLKKGEAVFRSSSSGLMYTKWLDTKEVILLSNCHDDEMTTIGKKQRDGQIIPTPCPKMIQFYREIMGGVDRADQMAGLYDLNRKSNKWWKKIFYRLLMMSVVNSWILYSELRRQKMPLIDFIVILAEELIAEGQKTAANIRSGRSGYISKKKNTYGKSATHLPIEGSIRRLCAGCRLQNVERRTKTIYEECEVPLCKNCFSPYHKR